MIIDHSEAPEEVWRHGRHDYFRFAELINGNEIGELDGISGGNITYNYLTDLKMSGTIKYDYKIDRGWLDKDIRVYMYSEPHHMPGVLIRSLLGTFRTTTPKVRIENNSSSYEITMYSFLLKLQNMHLRGNLSITAGTNVVDYVERLCLSAGLIVRKVESDYEIPENSNPTFDSGTPYLKMANELLAMAGYSGVNVDQWGNALLEPYVDPSKQAPVWTFRDTDDSIILPGLEIEWDVFDTPNVVILNASDPEGSMTVTVENNDPDSPYSIVNRGIEVVHVMEVDYLDTEEALIAIAQRQLDSYNQSVEAYSFDHLFAPVMSGNTVMLDYSMLKKRQLVTMHSMEISLTPGALTNTRVRWFRSFSNG